jgi:hypothetical protein
MHPSVHPQDNWKNVAQNCAPKVRLGKKMEGKKERISSRSSL